MELGGEAAICFFGSQDAVRDVANAKHFEMENVDGYEIFFKIGSMFFCPLFIPSCCQALLLGFYR